MTRLATLLPLLLMIPACVGLRAGAGSVAPVGGAAVASDPSTGGSGNAVGSAGGAGAGERASSQQGLANLYLEQVMPWAVNALIALETLAVMFLTWSVVRYSHQREIRRIDARSRADSGQAG